MGSYGVAQADVTPARRATVPSDLNDPARFGQPTETIKDAFVLELRRFFNEDELGPAADSGGALRDEVPNVDKYALGFGPGTDPYETTTRIVQENPDILENLPHVAVMNVAGKNLEWQAGQPVMSVVQKPPRVLGTVTEPFALPNPIREVRTLTVDTAAVATYTATIGGIEVSYTAGAGETVQEIAAEWLRAFQDVGPALSLALKTSRSGSQITFTRTEYGESFTLVVDAGAMTAALVTAAGSDTAPGRLVIRTVARDTVTPIETTVEFRPDRFPTAAPASAALAVDVARVINEQAGSVSMGRNIVSARAIAGAVQIEVVGHMTNEVEILAGDDNGAIAVLLGLGSAGTALAADTVTQPIDTDTTTFALTLAAAPFGSIVAGQSITLGGLATADNNGRFLITSVPGAGSVQYLNSATGAQSEVLAGGETWFIGAQDDWQNPLRPPLIRRQSSWGPVTVSLMVLTESPTTRTELADLVAHHFGFQMHQQHFEILGRGFFDEAYDDEFYQISLHRSVSLGGEADAPRGEDQKNRVYSSSLTVPISLWWYNDRTAQGTLTAECLTEDPFIDPTPST